MIATVFVASLACILALFYWYYTQKQKYKTLDIFPGPPPLPIIGNVLDAGTNTIEQLQRLFELQKEYGNVYRLQFGIHNLLVASDPDIIEFFLANAQRTYKDFLYNLFYSWLGQGLLTSNGTHWHKHRKLLTPAFHFKILEQFASVFNSNARILINKLTKETSENKDGIDIYSQITLFALDTICETSMGTSVMAQAHPEHKYVKAVELLRKKLIERVFSSWKQNDFLFKFASCYNDVQNALKTVHSFVRTVIEQRREELVQTESKTEDQENADDIGAKKRMSFLDIMLKSTIDGRPIQNNEIHDEVNSFMFAGHDTTTSTGFFSLYAIAKYPEIQQKILEELIPIFDGDSNKELTLSNLQEMKYLERVIKETLRYYPAAPIISRTVENDLEYKGNILPKGTVIIIFIFGMQRDPKFFPNPDEFNPDRFLIENTSTQNPFIYIPFSAGPRNCIGQKFAMLELKTLLSMMVYNFEITLTDPDKPIVLSSESILSCAETQYFNLKKRIL